MTYLTLGWLSLIGATASQVIDAAAASGFRSVSIRVTGRKLSGPLPRSSVIATRAFLQRHFESRAIANPYA